ncbi:MAG: selenide, water dikinase SelD [Saprospiraceae bacterium]|nr:selenide, water dikinase SelD [Saprospiraceae bacterium]
MNKVKLTQYSHGAGCGCKISPSILDSILHSEIKPFFPDLIVGYDKRDDAAVLDLKNGTALISTTDFFMPIVDDAFDFGRIASVNAISDVYAMGGRPVIAIGILGWPVDKLAPDIAAEVIRGAREVCNEVSIPLAGGHSIDSPEPIFGLAVNGLVEVNRLKTNASSIAGDIIYLTKPLGVGVLTTAEKKAILKDEHKDLAKESMLKVNKIGRVLSEYSFVHAITDVTGFGLGGHLLEMCEASNLNAFIHYVKLPLIHNSILDYIQSGAVPGGTHRNWKSYGHKIKLSNDEYLPIVADPQTSGGLLISVDPANASEFESILKENNCIVNEIGRFTKFAPESQYRIIIE